MSKRYGKIARLPRALQTEVNRRLAAGEPSRILLAWLNAQPEVQTLLANEFAGLPVNKQNLSQWRLGSFQEYLLQLDAEDYCQDMAANADELDPILKGRLADSLAAFMTVRYASLLRNWSGEVTPEFEQKLRLLRGIMGDLTRMRRIDPPHRRVRVRPAKHPARPEPTLVESRPSASRPLKNPGIKVDQSQSN